MKKALKVGVIKKATEAEKTAYWGPGPNHPCYRLYGLVRMSTSDGVTMMCAVEHPNEGPDGPNYEIMMPSGYTAESCHSLLCYNLEDLKSRAYCDLEKCVCDDQCGEYWEGVEGLLPAIDLRIENSQRLVRRALNNISDCHKYPDQMEHLDTRTENLRVEMERLNRLEALKSGR